jgi:hypothetical protein
MPPPSAAIVGYQDEIPASATGECEQTPVQCGLLEQRGILEAADGDGVETHLASQRDTKTALAVAAVAGSPRPTGLP